MNNPKRHEAWPYFVVWAKANCVSLANKVDWLPWWDCYKAGCHSAFLQIKEVKP